MYISLASESWKEQKRTFVDVAQPIRLALFQLSYRCASLPWLIDQLVTDHTVFLLEGLSNGLPECCEGCQEAVLIVID